MQKDHLGTGKRTLGIENSCWPAAPPGRRRKILKTEGRVGRTLHWAGSQAEEEQR